MVTPEQLLKVLKTNAEWDPTRQLNMWGRAVSWKLGIFASEIPSSLSHRLHCLYTLNSALSKLVETSSAWLLQKSHFFPVFPFSILFLGQRHARSCPLGILIPFLLLYRHNQGVQTRHSPHSLLAPSSISPQKSCSLPQPTSAWPVPIVPLKGVLHKCFLKEQNPLSLFTILQALEKNATNSFLCWPHQETRSPTVEGKSTRNQAVKSGQPGSSSHKGSDPCFSFHLHNPQEDRPPLTRSTRFTVSVPLSHPLLSWFLAGGTKFNVMIYVWKEQKVSLTLNWTRTFRYGDTAVRAAEEHRTVPTGEFF